MSKIMILRDNDSDDITLLKAPEDMSVDKVQRQIYKMKNELPGKYTSEDLWEYLAEIGVEECESYTTEELSW